MVRTIFSPRRSVVAVAAVLGLIGLAPISGNRASATASLTATNVALNLAQAVVDTPGVVTGAALLSAPPGAVTTAVVGGVGGFPTGGSTALLMSTGNPSSILLPNTAGNTGTNLAGPTVRGNTDFDVTILRIDLNVPATANCLVGLDFRFFSEEYPEYVGSSYNDAFIAELDQSTWTTSGSTISAPRNFAFDPSGKEISINATGATSMTPAQAVGTTFDGATPALTAATPITPGVHRLFLSIFDQGDRIYDSAVIIDNLRFGYVSDVPNQCKTGAVVLDKSLYVGLGDSYSSGFGNAPYFPGTNKDTGPNDCQRSTRAFAPVVAQALSLKLEFHACQGAISKDFSNPRNATWGELAQNDYLKPNAGLVTFSIGGNDAKFADVLAECILGFELLPFNTCNGDDKVQRPVREAFARLDGTASTPADITPYATLFSTIRAKTPIATRVAVGYPRFYTANGSDRTFLPGGRCEGVKKADQRWMVQKIDELNTIIERNARRNGFLFANPNPGFTGHELCSGNNEWIYGLLSSGRVHPTVAGQNAMADAVLAVLQNDGFQRLQVLPNQTRSFSFVIGSGKQFVSVVTGWPGSDVITTLVSPSGRRYTRQSTDHFRNTGPTFEHIEVQSPEAGSWVVEVFGADVPAAGEPVVVSTYVADPTNVRPQARIQTRIASDGLTLDASASTDSDGTIVGYDWYIATPTTDTVLQGRSVTIPWNKLAELNITLVVADNGGLTDFARTATTGIDVKPGSDVNPIQLTSKGVVPIAVLSTPTLDATTAIDRTSLTAGPNAARPDKTSNEDVNADGRPDLMVHVPQEALGLTLGSTQLCVSGTLKDTSTFTSCDSIRAQ